MGERLMTELFFKHRPTAQGELDEKDAARLNRILATLYERVEEDTDTELPPPEPLPKGSLGYGAFRSHLHRALAALASDVTGRERLLERLIEEVQKPDPEKEATSEVVPPILPPVENERDACIEDVSADLPHCIALPMLLGSQRVQAYVQGIDDGKAGSLAKTALISSRRYGKLALESSKQALERAKEYGLSVSESFRGQLQKIAPEQSFRCMPRVQDDGQVVVEQCETVGVKDQFDELFFERPSMETAVECQTSFGEEDFVDLVSPSVPSFGSQISFCGQQVEAFSEEASQETNWRFDAGDGNHIDLRTHPDISAPRTGGKVLPGECFAVSCELPGTDGVLYLQLADGRGWLFDHKPGFGPMCLRA